MRLLLCTLFVVAGFAVSSVHSENCTTLTTHDACCDQIGCAFAACEDDTDAKCFEEALLSNATDPCYNKSSQCDPVVTIQSPNDTNANTTVTPAGNETTTEAATTGSTGTTTTTRGSETTNSTDKPLTSTSTTLAPGPTTTSSEAPTGTPTTSSSTPSANTTGPTSPSGGEDCNEGQSFDAASFIGGIVLAIGVMGIVFLGCKFFRAKSEQSYHQF